jgi:hypothetical protein
MQPRIKKKRKNLPIYIKDAQALAIKLDDGIWSFNTKLFSPIFHWNLHAVFTVKQMAFEPILQSHYACIRMNYFVFFPSNVLYNQPLYA